MDSLDPIFQRANQIAIFALPDDLGDAASRASDHRRPAGEGFGEDKPERFVSLDRHKHGGGAAQQGILLPIVYGAHISDLPAVDFRCDRLAPIARRRSIGGVIAREQEGLAGGTCDRNRLAGSLDLLYSAKKDEGSIDRHLRAKVRPSMSMQL